MVSIKRFFYDSYSKSIDGSIFDGLKMDHVSFRPELLESNSRGEQLIGPRISKLAGKKKSAICVAEIPTLSCDMSPHDCDFSEGS